MGFYIKVYGDWNLNNLAIHLLISEKRGQTTTHKKSSRRVTMAI